MGPIENIAPDDLISRYRYKTHHRTVRTGETIPEVVEIFIAAQQMFLILVTRHISQAVIFKTTGLQLPVYLPPDYHLVVCRIQGLTKMRVGITAVTEFFFLVAPSPFLYTHHRHVLVFRHGLQYRIRHDHPILPPPGNDFPTGNVNGFIRTGVKT